VVQLLDPPFDRSVPSPGYIQGYLPGVRENGGQYTHAAVWVAMAFAGLGDAQRAWELFTMLNPIRHADSAPAIARYKVEPYVIASDVYAMPPHTGRGGWTWYTGSAGWMLRFMLESVLGLSIEGTELRMNPCCPEDWPSFELNYRWRDTLYRIEVHRSCTDVPGSGWSLDGVECAAPTVSLVDDRRDHAVIVRFHRRGA
jgi:cellobiose phosphorylase